MRSTTSGVGYGSIGDEKQSSPNVSWSSDSGRIFAAMHCEDFEVAIESVDVFLVCELMMDFPCADYCEMIY